MHMNCIVFIKSSFLPGVISSRGCFTKENFLRIIWSNFFIGQTSLLSDSTDGNWLQPEKVSHWPYTFLISHLTSALSATVHVCLLCSEKNFCIFFCLSCLFYDMKTNIANRWSVVCSLKSCQGVNIPHLIMNQFRWLSRVVESKVSCCWISSICISHSISACQTQ